MKAMRALGLLMLAILCAGMQRADLPVLQVEYFYESYCVSCHEDREFYELFAQYAPALEGREYVVSVENTAQAGRERFERRCQSAGIAQEDRVLPALFVGDAVLFGKDAIAQGLALANPGGTGEVGPEDFPDDPPAEDEVLVYFYTSPCMDCSRAGQWLTQLTQEHEQLVCQRYSILDPVGYALLKACLEAWNVPLQERQVPIVFYAGGYCAGLEAMEREIPQRIGTGDLCGFRYPAQETAAPGQSVGAGAALAAGVLAGMNPCSLSLFFFLIAGLQTEKPLRFYMAYIAGRSSAYFIFCALFLHVAASLWDGRLQAVMYAVQGVLAAVSLCLAALNLADFYQARAEYYGRIRLQLPARLRAANQKTLAGLQKMRGRWLGPVLFGAGALMAGGEFLCTGQVTLAGLILMVESGQASDWMLVPYIVGLSLPMLAACTLVARGKQLFDLTELARKSMPAVKLVNAALFAGMAVYFAWQILR